MYLPTDSSTPLLRLLLSSISSLTLGATPTLSCHHDGNSLRQLPVNSGELRVYGKGHEQRVQHPRRLEINGSKG